jgi:PTH1 family peptidyl-tRNA hydrolase
MALERAARRWSIPLSPIGLARHGSGRVGFQDTQTEVTLATPLTWMNQAGPAVETLVQTLGFAPDQLLDRLVVIHDDLDLPLGRLRIRRRGGSGGHNGLLSIMTTLNTDQFCRLKLGIGRPPLGVEAADYVLAPFLPEENPHVDRLLDEAVAALECLITEGVGVAMNRFNVREKEDNSFEL